MMENKHEHKWRYRPRKSKTGKVIVIERMCKCGVSQWGVIEWKNKL